MFTNLHTFSLDYLRPLRKNLKSRFSLQTDAVLSWGAIIVGKNIIYKKVELVENF